MTGTGDDVRGLGLELSSAFHREAVRPILFTRFPRLNYSAALIGPGSEVLGYDDRVSQDHHWGPRELLFVDPEIDFRFRRRISNALAEELPYSFRGYPTNFSRPDAADHGNQMLEEIHTGPVNHRVEVVDIPTYAVRYLGIDILLPLEPADWLSLPQQKLLSLVRGAVHHDGLPADRIWPDAASSDGALAEFRRRLNYYPDDVWRYLLAAGWARIGQEEHLVGRAAMVGDEIGSSIIGARLARDIMRLCFLMERQYIPYAKWIGTAFQELDCASQLLPALRDVLHAQDWDQRQIGLAEAYVSLARLHNALGLTRPLPETTAQFFDRPILVIATQGFSDALLESITAPWLTRLLAEAPFGSIDLLSDNTDLLEAVEIRETVRSLFQPAGGNKG